MEGGREGERKRERERERERERTDVSVVMNCAACNLSNQSTWSNELYSMADMIIEHLKLL